MKIFVKVQQDVKLSESNTDKSVFNMDLNTEITASKKASDLKAELKAKLGIDETKLSFTSETLSVAGATLSNSTKVAGLTFSNIIYSVSLERVAGSTGATGSKI